MLPCFRKQISVVHLLCTEYKQVTLVRTDIGGGLFLLSLLRVTGGWKKKLRVNGGRKFFLFFFLEVVFVPVTVVSVPLPDCAPSTHSPSYVIVPFDHVIVPLPDCTWYRLTTSSYPCPLAYHPHSLLHTL